MYKNNSRNSSKFKDCSQLQLFCKLKDFSSEVGYYSYTDSWAQSPFDENINEYFR